MKRKASLLVIAFAITSLFNSKAQVNLTNLIVNPSFETGDYSGWTWTGRTGGWENVNADGDATKNGTYIAGHWNNNIGDVECSQTITGLADGYYMVTALATISTNRTTTQRLFANNKSTLYGANNNPAYSPANLAILGATESYSFGGYAESTTENGPFRKLSVVTQVFDGQLTYGFRFNGKGTVLGYDFSYSPKTDAGFFKFDNFTLSEVSEVVKLGNITLSTGTLSPAFNENITDYTAILPVGTTTVTPTATLLLEGQEFAGTDAVDVSSGSGVSKITVTAFDGISTGVYTIAYTVLQKSNDASLSILSTSAGTLFPSFDPSITTYNVLVPIGTTSVKPTAVKNDAKASLTGDAEVALVNGKAVSTIVVTAENSETKTYTINYDYAYITNPSFETGDFTGWTWIGADGYTWLGVNSDGDATKNGSYVGGAWNSSFGDVELSQVITGLPNGLYTVSADLLGSSNVTTSRLTTQRLFANGKCMLFGAETDYSAENLAVLINSEAYSFGGHTETMSDNGPFKKLSVTIPVTNGSLTLGVRTNGLSSFSGYTFPNLTAGNGHGWFKVDNFSMTYTGILTGVSQVTDTNNVSYSVVNGQLLVKGAESFVVYNLQGVKVADVQQNTSKSSIGLTSGVYIVKANGKAFKVLVK